MIYECLKMLRGSKTFGQQYKTTANIGIQAAQHTRHVDDVDSSFLPNPYCGAQRDLWEQPFTKYPKTVLECLNKNYSRKQSVKIKYLKCGITVRNLRRQFPRVEPRSYFFHIVYRFTIKQTRKTIISRQETNLKNSR